MATRLDLSQLPLNGGYVPRHPRPGGGPELCGTTRRSASCTGKGAGTTDVLTQKQRKELLWQDFFLDPSDWLDNRADKKSPRDPDFRHKSFKKEPLWLSSSHKPAWVDAQLARWDLQMRGPGPGPGSDDDGDGDAQNGLVRILSKRCEEAELLSEAVEALDLLVARKCPISKALLYRVLSRCMDDKDFVCGGRVYSISLQAGHGSNAFLANQFIGMYASHGKLEEARQVFTDVSRPDVHMWSSIILAHARYGEPAQAISLYRQMRDAAVVEPDNHIFVAVLKACASAEDLVSGKQVHADIQASAVKPDIFLGNSLVSMYAKCGSLGDARRVFDSLPQRDVVTWTTMIAGYSQHGLGREALTLYAGMEHDGTTPANRVTFMCLLQACASVGALQQGKQLHSHIRERGLESDVQIGNCLVDMYAKCGSLEDARRVFDSLTSKDVVTWTAMLAGYSQQGLGREALALYGSMQSEGITPADHVIFVSLLQACASVGALQQGKELHTLVRAQQLEDNMVVGNSLVDLYAKCGSLEDARRVFDRLPTRDTVTWTAMLNGYAQHSDGRMATGCFERMLEEGIRPDAATFTSLLVACSHAGLVREGQRYFRTMVEDHGIVPSDVHYSCMVDLLSRSGKLDEAENMLRSTSFGNDVVGWTALLSACKSHGDVERGRRCFEHLVGLEPYDASSYVLLGTIYANAGRWDDVDRIESMRKAAGAVKKAAKACIEVKKEVHEFTVGEERPDISSTLLRSVNRRLREGGHVPQTELVLKAVSEEEKEDSLCGHAEKLALAYGLLNTPDGSTLVVTKNLRMCDDCHSSTKVMSHLEKREIIVRDAHRVHRFVDGSCSCGDRH